MKTIQKITGLIILGVLLSCTGKNTPSEWISLFDGESLEGWKRYNHDEIGPLWSIDEGSILCDGYGHGEGSGDIGGSLITIEKFEDFELELEWRISEGGNSGILYHVVEKPEYSHAYVTGPEFQLRDEKSADGPSANDKNKTGSSYDMYAAPYTKKIKPAMEWNTARIIYNKGKVEHWLNGEKVVAFDESSEDFQKRYTESKWSSDAYPSWNVYKDGSIGLQDHGAQVWYRNIRVRKL